MEPFIGQISLFAGNFAPQGWALCNGQLMQINQNQALFAILGTTYGGDGKTTFGLPDLRGRVAIHFGQGNGLTPRNIGQNGGSETVTLNITQIPAHTHTVNPQYSNSPGQISPANNFPANLGGTNAVYGTSGNGPMGSAIVSSAGGSQPHENMQPWLCLNYIIALNGIFPTRG